MGQTKFQSFIESLTNILIGFVVAFVSQVVIFHQFGVEISLGRNLEMTVYFTIVSFIRSYTLRRIFNRMKGST